MRMPLAAAGLVLCVTALGAQGKPAAKPPALKWGPAPAVFPKGATMAVVSGDPGAAAMFTIRLRMPDGYKIMPHNHPTDESVEVVKGTFLVGMGDKFDGNKTNAMAVGAKGTIKAQMNHYAVTKGATTVAVTAMGPFAMTYVNPADDPSKMAPKK